MTDEDRIERFLLNAGFVVQSLDAVRPDLPRWVRRLRAMGIAEIPTSLRDATPRDARAMNLLSQFALQASPRRDPIARSTAHNLRDLTGIRPPKP
jgi:hypothetical protein